MPQAASSSSKCKASEAALPPCHCPLGVCPAGPCTSARGARWYHSDPASQSQTWAIGRGRRPRQRMHACFFQKSTAAITIAQPPWRLASLRAPRGLSAELLDPTPAAPFAAPADAAAVRRTYACVHACARCGAHSCATNNHSISSQCATPNLPASPTFPPAPCCLFTNPPLRPPGSPCYHLPRGLVAPGGP